VNVYEQLIAIRDQLEQNGANEVSITLVEKFIQRAQSERDSATNVAQIQMVRHLLKQKEALDNDAVYNDLQELMDSYTTRRVSDDDVRPAYEEAENRPKPHSYYKQQKSQR
jgi:polyribonucleotide nucleotidyltransferase